MAYKFLKPLRYTKVDTLIHKDKHIYIHIYKHNTHTHIYKETNAPIYRDLHTQHSMDIIEYLPMVWKTTVQSQSSHNKMALDASMPKTQHSKVQMKGEWSKREKGVAPSPKHQGSSY